LNKALLSENQKDLNRLLKKLLNNVYTFALIKERYFYKSALEEIERMKEIEKKRNEGIEEFDNNDLLTVINHQSIE
jgi:hypothetical protein